MTAQWRPKEPPVFTGNTSNNVYLWTSSVRQYLVFMDGTARQEVVFAATLLRGVAHEWYRGYEQRNGNKPPQDGLRCNRPSWDRFGFEYSSLGSTCQTSDNISGQNVLSGIIRQNLRCSLVVCLPGRKRPRKLCICGLQPHLAGAVALKYPTSIAQAVDTGKKLSWQKRLRVGQIWEFR